MAIAGLILVIVSVNFWIIGILKNSAVFVISGLIISSVGFLFSEAAMKSRRSGVALAGLIVGMGVPASAISFFLFLLIFPKIKHALILLGARLCG